MDKLEKIDRDLKEVSLKLLLADLLMEALDSGDKSMRQLVDEATKEILKL